MTENKRFEYKNHKVYDNLTGETHSSNRVSVNVLNELNDENKELRMVIDGLKQQNQKLKGRLNDLGVEYYG